MKTYSLEGKKGRGKLIEIIFCWISRVGDSETRNYEMSNNGSVIEDRNTNRGPVSPQIIGNSPGLIILVSLTGRRVGET